MGRSRAAAVTIVLATGFALASSADLEVAGAQPAPGPAARTREQDPATLASFTDPSPVYTTPVAIRPLYLTPTPEPTFGTQIMRITNDAGRPLQLLPGWWGSDARHVYSKQQPWNSDNTLLDLENHGGGEPSTLILDGNTFAPRLARCPDFEHYDYRWHPSPAHPHEQINVDRAGSGLEWFDVTTCIRTRAWTLPIAVDGFGSGEGNPSNDGRFVALGNATAMVVVDMDPQLPYAPYPNKRIGPVYTFPPCSLGVTSCTPSNLSVSPSGRYVEVKYSGADSLGDVHRIYEIDPVTLALKPHNMAAGSQRCGSFAARPNGWVYPVKHADMALDPFDANEDVIIGGRACPGSTLGHVVKVRLRDGRATSLTDPDNVASVSHVSTRNLDRPGWAYVSFLDVPGKRFSNEIIAVKLDGSLGVERYAHMHSAASGCYRCEAHPVPSRDGRRVLFASNWASNCGTSCGPVSDIKDFIVWNPGAYAVASTPTPVTAPGVALAEIRPNPSDRLPTVIYTLASSAPATLELVDVAGRRMLSEDLGAPGPGQYERNLARHPGPRAGLYWLRLRQGTNVVTRVIVITQ